MEVEIIKIYASLILTFIGFVLPILAILLSLFSEGVKALADKYENEKKQSEDNLVEETKKRESGKELDYKALGKTLKTLKKRKRQAEDKLKYLKPAKFIRMAFIPFVVSLIAVAVILQNTSPIVFSIAIISSVLSFFLWYLYFMGELIRFN